MRYIVKEFELKWSDVLKSNPDLLTSIRALVDEAYDIGYDSGLDAHVSDWDEGHSVGFEEGYDQAMYKVAKDIA